MSLAQLELYPNVPAGRGTETSRQAARDIRSRASELREQILAMLHREPMTTHQLAQRLAPTPLCTVKPRLSELRAAGKIEPAPGRVPGPVGWKVNRWQIAVGGRAHDTSGLYHPTGPDAKRKSHANYLAALRATVTPKIVRALAENPTSVPALSPVVKTRQSSVAGPVSYLRRAGIVQPSGLHGISQYGKKVVRWQLRPGPYAPDVPASLLAVIREVLGPKADPGAKASQLAVCP